MHQETTTKTFNVVDLFEYHIKKNEATISGIPATIPIKTIVETTTWYNTAVANGFESRIVGATAPIGFYNGKEFEIKTRRAETTSDIFKTLNNHLEEGETLILLEISSTSAVDPDTFDLVHRHIVRYASVL